MPPKHQTLALNKAAAVEPTAERAPVILAIDAGASCGYAVARVHRETELKTAEVVEYGYLSIDTSSPYIGDWCRDLMARLTDIQSRVAATDIAVEDYFFSMRTRSGANVNPMYRAAVYIWAREAGLPHYTLGITNWKTLVAGRSTPTREEKAAWGAERAKKLMIVKALWERHQIRFPNFSVSEATGKPISLRLDCVDAVGQVLYAAHLRYACRDFKCSVPVPPDHVFPKGHKNGVDYASFANIGVAAKPAARRKPRAKKQS